MNIINEIFSVIHSIIKSNIIIAIIVFISYLIEINSNWVLLVKRFKMKKNKKQTQIASKAHAGFYSEFILMVFIYDLYKGNFEFTFLTVFVWLIIVIFLTILLYKLYSKYQGFDPDKKDDDFSLD